MKRKLFISVVLIATITVAAQDIIVTKDAKKIDAKILEVSKSEIKYKEADNLDGPTFILTTDEIKSVIYANGHVQLYEEKTDTYNDDITERHLYDNKANIFTLNIDAATSHMLTTDELLIVENWTKEVDSFIIVGCDALSRKWAILGETQDLSPHQSVLKYAIGSKKYEAFRYKSSYLLNSIPNVNGNFAKIAIISKNKKIIKAMIQHNKSNLVIKIYDQDDSQGVYADL